MDRVVKPFWIGCGMAVLGLFTPMGSAEPMPRRDVIEVPATGEGLRVHNLFQSNMVLQRDVPVSVWGWAAAGESVSVTWGEDKQTVQGAAKDGQWKVTFPARPASATPGSLVVQGRTETLTLENVLVGDVWVLGGQSNMEFPMSKVENGALEIASANFPEIRILTVPYGEGPEVQRGFARLHQWSAWSGRHFRKGDWDTCSPAVASELSAIGLVFGRRLHHAAQIPIGLIDVSRGGTTVEAWTPESRLRALPDAPVKNLLAMWDEKVAAWDGAKDLEQQIQKYHDWVARMKKDGKAIPEDRTAPTEERPGPARDPNRPGNCYAGMIGPLEGLRVKGAIFHQGYNNCFSGTEGARMYRAVFPELIAGWRAAFGDPKMPFGILSLCTAGEAQTGENYSRLMFDVGPYIREAQYQTFLALREAGDDQIGFVSTYDLRRRWYHPQLKNPAGERIARWALATQYDLAGKVRWKPPMIQEMTVEPGRIVLRMDEPVGGVDDGSAMVGFAVAGEDRRFHPATVLHLETGKDDRGRPKLDRRALTLSSALVQTPVHYRYAWARNPMGNIQADRNADLPLATQRSDTWPLEEVPFGVIPADQVDTMQDRQKAGLLKKALAEEDIRRRVNEARETLRVHAAEGE